MASRSFTRPLHRELVTPLATRLQSLADGSGSTRRRRFAAPLVKDLHHSLQRSLEPWRDDRDED